MQVAVKRDSGAISNVMGQPKMGETVEVYSSEGDLLAMGAYSPYSNIRIRAWTFGQQHDVNDYLLHTRILTAYQLRKRLNSLKACDAYRLFFGESDGIPGFIADVYGNLIVAQFLSAGAEYWRNTIVDSLVTLFQDHSIYERSDVDVRKLEGLSERSGWIRGKIDKDTLVIHENGIKYQINYKSGHKTGFYLDQRVNREVYKIYTQSKTILDCFTYTGCFAIVGARNGAKKVTAIDQAEDAIQLAEINRELNKISDNTISWIVGDVFQEMRKFRDHNKKFDLIILDPPKFAPTQAHIRKASRGYKDINLLALKLLNPGGYLFTFSCSGGVSIDLFQKIIAGAALDAGVEGQIVDIMYQAQDHPVLLNFPESAYLKGFVIQKI